VIIKRLAGDREEIFFRRFERVPSLITSKRAAHYRLVQGSFEQPASGLRLRVRVLLPQYLLLQAPQSIKRLYKISDTHFAFYCSSTSLISN
jgi:hypothetical protein